MTTTSAPRPPYPVPDCDSAGFWDALADHRITYQRCPHCGHKQIYSRAVCGACWSSDLVVETSDGTGIVYSFTVLANVGNAALAKEAPLVIAVLELDEGVRILSRIEGSHTDVRIGARVAPIFRSLEDGPTLLHFELAAGADDRESAAR